MAVSRQRYVIYSQVHTRKVINFPRQIHSIVLAMFLSKLKSVESMKNLKKAFKLIARNATWCYLPGWVSCKFFPWNLNYFLCFFVQRAQAFSNLHLFNLKFVDCKPAAVWFQQNEKLMWEAGSLSLLHVRVLPAGRLELLNSISAMKFFEKSH